MTLLLCHDLRKRRASSAAPPLFSSFLSLPTIILSLYQANSRSFLSVVDSLLFSCFFPCITPESVFQISCFDHLVPDWWCVSFSRTLSNPNNSPIEITAYPAIMNSLVATPPVPPHFYEPPHLSPSRPSKPKSRSYTLNSRSVVLTAESPSVHSDPLLQQPQAES